MKVIHSLRTSLILLPLSFFLVSSAFAVASFEEVTERDVPLKKSLPLYLQHRIGNVSVQGWVQDRIRITIKKKVLADTDAAAKREFGKLDLITLETSKAFEIRIGHSKGTDIVSKMKDRLQAQVQVDLEIKAPYQSDLTLVTGEGKNVKVLEWRGGLDISGKNNSVQLSKLTLNQPILMNCLQCDTEIRESKMEGHLLVGSKTITLIDVDAKDGLSIDEGTEEVKLENTRGKINIHSKSGRLTVMKHNGTINFQSSDGGAYVSQFAGNLNVQTSSGQVILDIDSVKNELNVDTDKSDVQISLPSNFSGLLDLMSLRGEIVVQYPYEQKKGGADIYGPASPGRVDGVVGTDNKTLIHAYSKQGGVRVLRKAISR